MPRRLALGLGLGLGLVLAPGPIGNDAAEPEVSPPPPQARMSVLSSLPAGGASVARAPSPPASPAPQRIGIQAGHWLTDEVPDELAKLRDLGGGYYGDLTEGAYVLDIARRVAMRLAAKGYVVDVLPATVPERYRADVFVSLHADGDETGTARGYKVAHGAERGPYEDTLVGVLTAEYARATHLPLDTNVTDAMTEYYAFRYWRFHHAVAPLTPAAIIELGFLTNAADRTLLLRQRDLVAIAIANAIARFLDEVPARMRVRDDLLLPLHGRQP